MLKLRHVLFSIAVTAALTTPALAQQTGGTKVGALTCRSSASLGLIIGSRQNVRCSFSPDGGPSENYVGHIGRLGLDLGVRGGGVMVWTVVAPTSGLRHGALAGNYVGVNADASLGLGAGAKVLVGGSHRSIALQPLSVSGQVGVNLALGVAGLTLRSVP